MGSSTKSYSLDSLCHNITDGKHGDCESQDDSGYYFLSAKDVFDGKLNYASARQITRSDFDDTHKRTRLEPLDIVFTNSGTIGRMALVRNVEITQRTTFQKSVAILKPNRSLVEPQFFYYLLAHEKTRLSSFAGGTAQANLLLRDLRSFEVEVPDKGVQRRIADVLSAYDDLIENNMKRIKILEEMARSLYREWFVEFRFPGHEKAKFVETEIGRVPKGWEVAPLEQVAAYINRGVAPKYDDNGSALVINQKCIRDQRVSLEPARKHATRVPSDKQVRHFDVLINSTGVGTLGRVAQVLESLEDCTVDTHVSIVRPDANVQPHFFGVSLLHRQGHFEAAGVGATGQTELARSRIATTQIVVAPIELQSRFDAIVGPCRDSVMALLKKNVSLRTARDLLLPRLISGEIELPT